METSVHGLVVPGGSIMLPPAGGGRGVDSPQIEQQRGTAGISRPGPLTVPADATKVGSVNTIHFILWEVS